MYRREHLYCRVVIDDISTVEDFLFLFLFEHRVRLFNGMSIILYTCFSQMSLSTQKHIITH